MSNPSECYRLNARSALEEEIKCIEMRLETFKCMLEHTDWSSLTKEQEQFIANAVNAMRTGYLL